MHESDKRFKGVFFVLLTFVILLIFGAMALIVTSSDMVASPDDKVAFAIMSLALLFSFGILALIGTVVYRDAGKVGMNQWMWLTIVVFVPNALGIIIYLVVRSSEKKKIKCLSCGETIQRDFAKCPHCGVDLKLKCSECKKAVDSDWKVCPYCSHQLKE